MLIEPGFDYYNAEHKRFQREESAKKTADKLNKRVKLFLADIDNDKLLNKTFKNMIKQRLFQDITR